METYLRLLPILECVDCRFSTLSFDKDASVIRCPRCDRCYIVSEDNILMMMPSSPEILPDIYQDPDYVAFKRLFDGEDAFSAHYANMNVLFHKIHHSAHRITHRFFERSPKGGWTVDVGCGTGDHLGYFGDLSMVIGVDISLGSLRAAKRFYPTAYLIQGDATSLPFKRGSIARIFSIHNLEHLYHLGDAVQEIDRILQDRGHFYVGLPTEGWLYQIGRKISIQRIFSKRYGFSYSRAIQIDHCNRAEKIISVCENSFDLKQKVFYPIRLLPSVHFNLSISLEFLKRKPLGLTFISRS